MAIRFQHRRTEEPEINLIPFIDVLLVILIFLMLSTTYSRFAELKVNLPVANAEKPREMPRQVLVAVTADGQYLIDRRALGPARVDALTAALREVAAGDAQTIVVVSADAAAAHQSVVNVMDAARRAGLTQLTFATQASGGAAR